MAIIGNDANTLLHGLSSFWQRFFKDLGDIQAVYEGTEVLMGQVYLNFLSDVLNTSVVEAPLFRKEYYKLITAREDQIVFEENNPPYLPPLPPDFLGSINADRFVLNGDTYYGSIPVLQNLIFTPTASLAEGADYDIRETEVRFKADPTEGPVPGFAARKLTIATGGQFYSSSVLNWDVAGVKKGDVLYFSETADLSTPPPSNQGSQAFADWLAALNTARKATIIHVSGPRLTVSASTPLPVFPTGATPSGFSYRIIRKRGDGYYNVSLPFSPAAVAPFTSGQIDNVTKTLTVNEVSFWAVDAKVDDLILYRNYGHFFTNQQVSTEAYRSLIRGLMQLYVLGPSMARLESALNLTAGFPTVLSDNEVLQSYDAGILAAGQGNVLADNIFEVAAPAFDESSVGGFLHLSDADNIENFGVFNIVEYVSPTKVKLNLLTLTVPENDVYWKYTKTNRQEVQTDKNTYYYPLETPIRDDIKDPTNIGVLTLAVFEPITTALRVTDYLSDPEWWHHIQIPQELMPEADGAWRRVNTQLYPNVIGPIGNINIGDPGFYIGADEDGHVVEPAYRHKASFILMDRFLKLHMFGVLVDSSVNLSGLLTSDLYKIIKDVKPVNTALYFRPVKTLVDYITATDYWTVGQTFICVDETAITPNELTIDGSWLIGSQWKFSGSTGGAITVSPPAVLDGDMIPVVIGGSNPNVIPGDPGLTGSLGLIDRALHVYQHA